MSRRNLISTIPLALVLVVAFGVLSAFGARAQSEGGSVVTPEQASVAVAPMGPLEASDVAEALKGVATDQTQAAVYTTSFTPMDLSGVDWTVPVKAKAGHGKEGCSFGKF